MNAYEQKQDARRERLLDLADRMQAASDANYKRARDMASIIPMGQPILVGHHSEKRDRAYRARIWRTQDRCLELQRKAEYFRRKAESVGEGGISSDDPAAVVKLRAELDTLTKTQARMKAANAAIRAGKDDAGKVAALIAQGFSDVRARQLLQPDFCGRIGFPGYALTNNNANIRRIQGRIAALTVQAGRAEQADKEHDCGAYRVRECFADNRVRVYFDGKPVEAVRDVLKRNGFHWSRTEGAWQRMLKDSVVQWLTREDGYLRRDINNAAGVHICYRDNQDRCHTCGKPMEGA